MNPEESIDLISRMISDTRRSVLGQSYLPFLTWGGATVVVAMLVYFLVRSTGDMFSYFCWYLIPVIAWPLTCMMRPHIRLARTGISTSLQSIWRMLTVLLICFSVSSFFIRFNILFFILLLLSIGSYVTGAVISYPFLKYSSIAGFAISVVMLLMSDINRIPVFAAAVAVMMIIPGVKMRQDFKNL